MADEVTPAGTRSPPRPTAVTRSMPSGRLASSASAPSSIATPATSDADSFPPSRDEPSRTVTRTCSPPHPPPGASRRAQFPPKPRRAFKDRDPYRLVPEEEGGRQARDPPADHYHVRRRVSRHDPSLYFSQISQ